MFNSTVSMASYYDGRATGLAKSRLVDGLMLGSRSAAAGFANRHVNLIRRYCQPIACDVLTRSLLYDLDAAVAHFATTPRRYRRVA